MRLAAEGRSWSSLWEQCWRSTLHKGWSASIRCSSQIRPFLLTTFTCDHCDCKTASNKGLRQHKRVKHGPFQLSPSVRANSYKIENEVQAKGCTTSQSRHFLHTDLFHTGDLTTLSIAKRTFRRKREDIVSFLIQSVQLVQKLAWSSSKS